MKSLKIKQSASSYIQSKPFGNYYLPARFQYVILRDYFKKKKLHFTLPQGEPVFSKNRIKLRDVIDKLKTNSDLVLLSIYILPNDGILLKEITNLLIKKKIKTHFIFENLLAKSKNEYSKITKLLRLNKFLKK